MLIVAVLFILLGCGLISYPFISDYINKMHSSHIMQAYENTVNATADFSEYFRRADAYNQALVNNKARFFPDEEEHAQYLSLLNLKEIGIMGYIEIPCISATIPIYHGTDDSVLQVAAGHIEGSSLPIGGENTHALLSGHRGLPSAELFTNLDQMECGDIFYLHILDRVLAYQVKSIDIVLPNELDLLEIEQGKDLCTLVTCTPYAVNTHRLLVRGERISMTNLNKESNDKENDSTASPLTTKLPVSVIIAWVLMLGSMLAGLFGIIFLIYQEISRSKRKEKNHENL